MLPNILFLNFQQFDIEPVAVLVQSNGMKCIHDVRQRGIMNRKSVQQGRGSERI
jgi:hypothetical protein